MKQRRSTKFPFLVGGLLLIIALAGFFSAYTSARDEAQIVVAAKNLPAFQPVGEGDITYKPVPKASITTDDLTREEYESRYSKPKRKFVPTALILKNERLQEGNSARDPRASFAIVSPDERVVAVTASLSGAAVGTIHAGDIVDVTQTGSSGGGGAAASFAKVICISDRADGCKNVIAPGVTVSAEAAGGSDDEPVNVLLAVSDEDAPALAGQTVALALNPFCEVDETGGFVRREGSQTPCQVDPDEADREAAKNAQATNTTDPAEGDE